MQTLLLIEHLNHSLLVAVACTLLLSESSKIFRLFVDFFLFYFNEPVVVEKQQQQQRRRRRQRRRQEQKKYPPRALHFIECGRLLDSSTLSLSLSPSLSVCVCNCVKQKRKFLLMILLRKFRSVEIKFNQIWNFYLIYTMLFREGVGPKNLYTF